MPRNSGGVYSLPAGNPVVTSTTISSTWANTTLSDLATAMTASVARDGSGGMLGAFLADSGSSATPGISWVAETNSGFYRAGSADFRWATAGVDVLKIAARNVTILAPASGIPLTITGIAGSGAPLRISDGTGILEAQTDSSHHYYLGTTSAHNFSLFTGGTTRLAVGATGQIVISAPTTGTALSVVPASSSYTIQAGKMYIGNDIMLAGANILSIGTDNFVYGTSSTGGAALYTNSVQRMVVNNIGNVTIAAPTSGSALTVTGASGLNTIVTSTTGSGYGFNSQDGTVTVVLQNLAASGSIFGTFTGHTFGLITNNTTRISIAAAGAVSIAAPSSGTTLTATAPSAGIVTQWQDGTVTVQNSFAATKFASYTVGAHPYVIGTNSSDRITVGSTGGIQFGSPTGGDKGAGTLNAASRIYQNNNIIPFSAFARVTAASGAVSNNQNITFTSHTASTGIYVFALAGFAATPVVCVTMQNASVGYATVTSLSNTSVQVTTYNTSGTPTDMDFSLIVQGAS